MSGLPRDEKVLIHPGAFNRKLDVCDKALLAILSPYVSMARALARPSWRKQRVDWGGVWNVPKSRGGFSVAGPAIGAPTAVLMIETLINAGVKKIVAVGCCGSISKDVSIGDIVVPTFALAEEGTSAHYRPDLYPPNDDEEVRAALLKAASDNGYPVKTGGIWTTDAPYRETADKVRDYGAKGLLAVEMELSAIFTVARFRGVKTAAVMAVSDELASLEWHPGFLKPAFLMASKRAIGIAIEALKTL